MTGSGLTAGVSIWRAAAAVASVPVDLVHLATDQDFSNDFWDSANQKLDRAKDKLGNVADEAAQKPRPPVDGLRLSVDVTVRRPPRSRNCR